MDDQPGMHLQSNLPKLLADELAPGITSCYKVLQQRGHVQIIQPYSNKNGILHPYKPKELARKAKESKDNTVGFRTSPTQCHRNDWH